MSENFAADIPPELVRAAYTCAHCGVSIEGQTRGSPGRPRMYCSRQCGRLVEYAKRRLDREARGTVKRSGGARRGAGRPRKRQGPPASIDIRVAHLSAALNEAASAIKSLMTEMRLRDTEQGKGERAKVSLAYAQHLLQLNMTTKTELPLALVEAKRLHLQIRRLCGYGKRKDQE